MAVKKTTTKQKQKQSQSVKVIVNLPEKKQRKKRSRKPKQREAEIVDFKAFPPQIIYPSAPLTFYQRPPEVPKSILSPPEPPRSFLEDIGQIGTEGRVEIIDLPTKVETLQDLESPVPVRTPRIPISLKELEERKKRPKPLPFREPQFPFSLEEFERTTKKNEDIPIRQPRVPASLAEITMKTQLPKSFAELPIEEPSKPLEEELFGLTPSEIMNEPFSSSQKPKSLLPRRPRRTKEEVKRDLENEYLRLSGRLPIEPVSNRSLKKMIFNLKKYGVETSPVLQSQSMQPSAIISEGSEPDPNIRMGKTVTRSEIIKKLRDEGQPMVAGL